MGQGGISRLAGQFRPAAEREPSEEAVREPGDERPVFEERGVGAPGEQPVRHPRGEGAAGREDAEEVADDVWREIALVLVQVVRGPVFELPGVEVPECLEADAEDGVHDLDASAEGVRGVGERFGDLGSVEDFAVVECAVVGGGVEDHRGGETSGGVVVRGGVDFSGLGQEPGGVLQGGEVFLEDCLADSRGGGVLIERDQMLDCGGDLGEALRRARVRQGVDFALGGDRDVGVQVLEGGEDAQ